MTDSNKLRPRRPSAIDDASTCLLNETKSDAVLIITMTDGSANVSFALPPDSSPEHVRTKTDDMVKLMGCIVDDMRRESPKEPHG